MLFFRIAQILRIKNAAAAKISLLDQVNELQLANAAAKVQQQALEKQLKNQHTEHETTAANLLKANSFMEEQKNTIGQLESQTLQLKKEQAETVESGKEIMSLLQKELPLTPDTSALLEEGLATASSQVLMSNIRSGITELHRIKVDVDTQRKSAAVQKVQREKELKEGPSKEDLDMKDFAARLDQVDVTKPLMEQLGMEE